MKGQQSGVFVHEVENLEARRAAIKAMGPTIRFVFRGYSVLEKDNADAPAALRTGLERVCWEIDERALAHAPRREVAIMREFMRRAHH